MHPPAHVDGSFPKLEVYKRMHLTRRVEEILIDIYHPAHDMKCPIISVSGRRPCRPA